MSLYIKTEDYKKYGITKTSDLRTIQAIVQREFNISPLYVSFVNGREFIRVDFLKPRRRKKYSRWNKRR
ncbi:MAG: hypothetical protein ACP5TY_07545 [Thermodesulforhabdaceae bacterium]|jgi:hypothetical protein